MSDYRKPKLVGTGVQKGLLKTPVDVSNEGTKRIKELEERLKAAQDDAKEAEAYAEELEAKLAKAVSFAEGVVRYAGNGGDDYLQDQARTTLAELKGAKE